MAGVSYMRTLLIILLLLPASKLLAQSLDSKIYFPAKSYTDSLSFENAMLDLADRLPEVYNDPDKVGRYIILIECNLLRREYGKTLAYIDSLQTITEKGMDLHKEVYVRAELIKDSLNQPFDQLYMRLFTEKFAQLTDKGQASALNRAGFAFPKDYLQTMKNDFKHTDSLSITDAADLLYIYGTQKLSTRIQPLINRFLKEEEEKRYTIGNLLIRTKGGNFIQAVLVRKKDIPGKVPAVFIFNIYIDSLGDLNRAKRYADEGYAGIVANTRGKGKSPHEIEPWEHDAVDAYEVIDWISRQGWSNGKVGMVGGSYLGFTQWAAAKKMHPALKTIMPQVAAAPGIDFPARGNVFLTYMLRWLHYVTNHKQTDYTDFNRKEYWDSIYSRWYQSGKAFHSLDSIEGRPHALFQRWLKHPSFDNYWQKMTTVHADFKQIRIPVLSTTGYYDGEQFGAIYYLHQHNKYLPNAEHYLVIGPYDHSGAQGAPSHELRNYKLDSVASAVNFHRLSVQWFNYVLKDSSKPALLKDRINYQVMGTNAWKHAPALAAMANDTLRLYLSNKKEEDHYATSDRPSATDYVRQVVDLADRTDTSGYEYGIIDSLIQDRNALVFLSQKLNSPLEISGEFTANLHIAINKKDIDLFIRIYEQMPDGKYFDLGWTIQRASYAYDNRKRQLLTPGRKTAIPIRHSFITSRLINAGSRIVLVAGVNKSKYWQINYGTGKEVSNETIADAQQPLQIKWFADSHLNLPVWRIERERRNK